MKPTQRAYEERRAIKAGKTLEEWILGKYPPDPLVAPDRRVRRCVQGVRRQVANLPELIEEDPSTVAQEIVAAAELAEIKSQPAMMWTRHPTPTLPARQCPAHPNHPPI